MYKERKIASFQQGKNKLQLLELTVLNSLGRPTDIIKYQIRLNRKRLQTSNSENQLRKKFLIEIQNILLQTELNITNLKQIYTEFWGGKYYMEEKEITQKQYWNFCYNNVHNIGTPVKISYDQTTKRYLTMKEITYTDYKKIITNKIG